MPMPEFYNFLKDFDLNKFSYDIEALAPPELKQSTNVLTKEQYDFISKVVTSEILALLQQYHQWLMKQRSLFPQEG